MPKCGKGILGKRSNRSPLASRPRVLGYGADGATAELFPSPTCMLLDPDADDAGCRCIRWMMEALLFQLSLRLPSPFASEPV